MDSRVGGILGVGIFSLAGLVAHSSATQPGTGPAVLFPSLIAGLASAAALSCAEFAGMIPCAGSAYTYGYVALDEVIGWFIDASSLSGTASEPSLTSCGGGFPALLREVREDPGADAVFPEKEIVRFS